MMRTFTKEELAGNNGKDGKPIYIAFKGNVYDVTQSPLWAGGDHQASHTAGADLSEDMEGFAPHGPEVLERYPKIGTLVES